MSDLKVLSSHLALRFYTHDGWTEEKVQLFIRTGGVKFWGEDRLPYYVGEVGTRYDVDELLRQATGGIYNWENVLLEGTEARNYVIEMNW